MHPEQRSIKIIRLPTILLAIILSIAFIAFFSFIYQILTPKDQVNSLTNPQNKSSLLAINEIEPTLSNPYFNDYRAILLLERATDLIITYVEKVRAGEIDPNDLSARQFYTLAFPVAIDAYNQISPPPIMAHAWKNVTLVATAYSQVYVVLQQGKPISENDLFDLRVSRQWLTNYQTTEEAILSTQGLSQEYITTEKQAVEELLKENYGDIPLPTPIP